MIAEQDLEKIGFTKTGEWNDRVYFSKNGFKIVLHCGLNETNERNWSGFGPEIKTIEELDKRYKKYVNKRIKTLEKEISKKQTLLNTLLMSL